MDCINPSKFQTIQQHAGNPDGVNWTKHINNPVFTIGESGEWDEDFVGSVSILFKDEIFHMWYFGVNSNDDVVVGYPTAPIDATGLFENTDNFFPNKYVLHQNYPNPFNPKQ